ncbi:MAG TPA: hypothetical protein VGL91_06035 [Acidobacteriota bacterium]
MIRYSQVDDFVGDEIAQDVVWCHYEPPVKGQIPQRGAVPPLGTLAHDIDLSGKPLQSACDAGEMSLDLFSRLPPQPVFQALARRRPLLQSSGYDKTTLLAGYSVGTSSMGRLLYPNGC